MMEQSDAGKRHHHIIFITGFDDLIVSNGAAGLCHIQNPALVRPLNVVPEREKCIASQRNSVHLLSPLPLRLFCECSGAPGEKPLPVSVR